MQRILKFALPVLLLGGLAAWRMLTPKGPLNIERAATELTINAGSLYEAFADNETTANGNYAGKVIEVNGVLQAVEQDAAGSYQLKLDTENPLGMVVCTLSKANAEQIKNLTIGSPVAVKGVCTGYLFDVVIDNAIILS